MMSWPDQVLQAKSPISQPFAYLSGGGFSGPPNPASPDPLSNYRWREPRESDPLQIYCLKPKSWVANPSAAFSNLASLTSNNPNVEVRGKGEIRLDFGVESGAWVEFDSPDCPGDIEMSISEYNEPGVFKTGLAKKHGNTYRLELNPELYDGVRFAWIRTKAGKKPWHITGVRAVCQVKPTNYVGRFDSSDPLLNRIWYMSAYGVKASLCQDYFGSILMDRGDRISWTGDAHPAQAAALVAFANYDFIKRNLANTSTQDNGIRSYALIWVLSLLDYYSYTGDAATLAKYLDNATKKLDSAYKVFGTDPNLRFYGWDERVGAGFEVWFRPCSEAQRAYEMLSIRVWNDFASAMDHLGRLDLRDKYREYARSKMATVRLRDQWHAKFGIHAAADAVNTSLLDSQTEQVLFQREFTDRVNRLSISPFNEYFILQALAKLNKWDEALCSVRDMWGGMLNYGGTTTFEVYRPSWNKIIGKNDAVPNAQCGIVSLCHPWGAGVVKWLSEGVLGIKPTSPGFSTFSIIPHLGSTLRRVSGTTPTPRGEISASFDLESGKVTATTPKGTVGVLGIPKDARVISRIIVNGKLVWDGRFHAVKGIQVATEDAEYVLLKGLQPGNYVLDVTYQGRARAPQQEKEVFPGRLVREDASTGGNWGGKYGKQGYVLCGYGADGADVSKLPSFVSSIDAFRAFPKAGRPDATTYAKQTSEHRALAPDPGNGVLRKATCLSNTDQTMSLRIDLKERRKYRVALYFLDWKNSGQRAAVEMFDAESLRMIAPVSIVKAHAGGKYLVFEYDRSVKFRFDKIRGELVTLSGIFFDDPQ